MCYERVKDKSSEMGWSGCLLRWYIPIIIMKVSELTEADFIHKSLILELTVIKARYVGMKLAYLFLYLLFIYFLFFSSVNGDGTGFQ